MTQAEQPNLRESLSALVDGETNEWDFKRVIAELNRDNGLREDWHLHHLTGATLQKSAITGVDLSAQISAAIASEAKPGQTRGFFKPFSQIAVAASVAIFALLGLQQLPIHATSSAPVQDGGIVSVNSENYQPVVIPEGFELPPLRAQTVSSNELVQINQLPEADSLNIQRFDRVELDRYIQQVISDHVYNTSETLNSVLPLARQINVETP